MAEPPPKPPLTKADPPYFPEPASIVTAPPTNSVLSGVLPAEICTFPPSLASDSPAEILTVPPLLPLPAFIAIEEPILLSDEPPCRSISPAAALTELPVDSVKRPVSAMEDSVKMSTSPDIP